MVKVDLNMMVMAEEVLTMAEGHVLDNQGHARHLLVERMVDLVAHHLDPQADLEEAEEEAEEEEEVMEEHLQV